MKLTFEGTVEELRELFETNGNKSEVKRVSYIPDESILWASFNKESLLWTKNPKYNLMFLKSQQRYMNDLLKCRKILYLNEVFDILQLPRLKYGNLLGWKYKDENSHIDLGLNNDYNKDFLNGLTPDCLLRFNINGIFI